MYQREYSPKFDCPNKVSMYQSVEHIVTDCTRRKFQRGRKDMKMTKKDRMDNFLRHKHIVKNLIIYDKQH